MWVLLIPEQSSRCHHGDPHNDTSPSVVLPVWPQCSQSPSGCPLTPLCPPSNTRPPSVLTALAKPWISQSCRFPQVRSRFLTCGGGGQWDQEPPIPTGIPPFSRLPPHPGCRDPIGAEHFWDAGSGLEAGGAGGGGKRGGGRGRRGHQGGQGGIWGSGEFVGGRTPSGTFPMILTNTIIPSLLVQPSAPRGPPPKQPPPPRNSQPAPKPTGKGTGGTGGGAAGWVGAP